MQRLGAEGATRNRTRASAPHRRPAHSVATLQQLAPVRGGDAGEVGAERGREGLLDPRNPFHKTPIEHRHRDRRAQPRVVVGVEYRLDLLRVQARVVVHVVHRAGGAGAQELQDPDHGAQVHPAGAEADPAGRADVVLPDLHREVVEAPAVQMLVGVEVGVDEARQGELAAAVEDPLAGLRSGCFARPHGRDPGSRDAQPATRDLGLGRRGIAGQQARVANQDLPHGHFSSRRAAAFVGSARAASAPSRSTTREAAAAARRADSRGARPCSRHAA